MAHGRNNMLEKNFEVRKVIKNGKLSYMQVYPKSPNGKELFIYNKNNIDKQYILIDDERTASFSIQSINDAKLNGVDVDACLLEMLGEPLIEYYVAKTKDKIYYYEDLKELMDKNDVNLSIDVLYTVISNGFSIVDGDTKIYLKEMTKIQYDAIKEEASCSCLK